MASSVLILVPDRNTAGKHDMTGAFLPEAQGYARYRKMDPARVIVPFPATGTLERRRAPCVAALRALTSPIDTLAVFCHGYKDGLQCGFTVALGLDTLAVLLASKATIDAHVLLYACDSGRDADTDRADDDDAGPGGDGGFADRLRDACEAIGRRVTVMAHATRGHTTSNPYARRFAPDCQGKGGTWYVTPRSAHWPAWTRTLKLSASTLRFRFPMMSTEAIERELAQAPRGVA